MLGKLSESVCHSMIARYEREQAEKKEALRILDGKLAEFEKDAQDVDSFLAAIRKYVSVEQLDREMLLELIDRIEIGKSTGHAAGKGKTRDIVIHYNFVGHVAQPSLLKYDMGRRGEQHQSLRRGNRLKRNCICVALNRYGGFNVCPAGLR